MNAPSYFKLYEEGKLAAIKDKLLKELENCRLCPRDCRVNRLKGDVGFCKTGRFSAVSSFNLHFGEEPPLVGRSGSADSCNCANNRGAHSGKRIGIEVAPRV